MAQTPPSTTTTTNKPIVDLPSHFEKVASTYESTAAVMKDIASHLLTLPDTPLLTSHSVIHDNASGPGIVTGEILQLPQFTHGNFPHIHATDFSPAMIRALEARAKREAWPENGVVKAQVMDSADLSGFRDDMFTHAYMAAAIFLVPDPAKAAAEIKRTLKPGGVALVTSFRKQGIWEVFQDAQKAIRPDVPAWQGPMPGEWSTEGKLRAVMESGGFEAAKVEIRRHSSGVVGEEWSKPASALLREAFTKSITNGWSEEEEGRFAEKLMEDLESERVKSRSYEMKVWVAVARK